MKVSVQKYAQVCCALLACAGLSTKAFAVDTGVGPVVILPDTSVGIVAHPKEARGWQEKPKVAMEDLVLALPRAVLFVPRWALWSIFWPIQASLGALDRWAIIEHIVDVFYNDERTAGIIPSFLFSSTFGPTVGVTMFHNNVFGFDEHLGINARFGGRFRQDYQLDFKADRLLGSSIWLEAKTRFEANPGLLFAGIGKPKSDAPITEYQQDRVLGLLRTGYTSGAPGAQIKIGTTAIANKRTIEDGSTSNNRPPVSAHYNTSAIAGFGQTVYTLELNANLVVDYRHHRGIRATGLLLEAFVGPSLPVDGVAYGHYGVEAIYGIDIYNKTRILVLRAAVEEVFGASSNLPLSEMPRLGGPDRLRGYREARFRSRKAALTSVEYRYPIHQGISGTLFIDAGYVAPRRRGLFDFRHWKVGYGGSFLVGGEDSVMVRLDFSYGDRFLFFVSTDVARALKDRSGQL